MSLTGGIFEAEVVRRRSTAHVRDMNASLRTWAPFAEIAESAYITAPIIVEDRVAGLLHVDAGVSEWALGDTDVALVGRFADGIGILLEAIAFRGRFDAQAQKIQEALAAAAAAVTGVGSGPPGSASARRQPPRRTKGDPTSGTDAESAPRTS